MSTAPDWRAACADFAANAGLPADLVGLLDAFGRPGDAPRAGLDFGALEAAARADDPSPALLAALAGEVDADQAAMFARRAAAVARLLDALAPSDPAARLLRVGLWCRLHDVCVAAPPRALRVRAVVDFYYSQAAVRRHRRAGGPTLAARVAGLAWSPVAPGVRHARLVGPTDRGPVHAHLLEVGPGCRLAARDARGCGDFGAWVAAQGAVAATSGGFFLYSEADIQPPSARHDLVGLLVDDGEVVVPPILRRTAVAQGTDGAVRLARLGPTCATLTVAGRRLRPVATNAPAAVARLVGGGPTVPVVAFNRAFGATAPPACGPTAVVVGHGVVARGRGATPIPLHGLVLALPPGVDCPLGPVAWAVRGDVAVALAGGPRLLSDGALDLDRAADDLAGHAPPVTFSQDETFDQNLLPRLVVGQRPSGGLVLAALDGRDMAAAPGFTLRGAATLLRHLGCTQAVNLDGGSSKRMVVAGRVVDRPSTEVRDGAARASVRPVHSALLVFASA